MLAIDSRKLLQIKTGDRYDRTQLAKMSIDPKFIELTASWRRYIFFL